MGVRRALHRARRPSKAIQERLGHSSIAVTLDRYGHLFPKLDETPTTRLDALHASAVDAT